MIRRVIEIDQEKCNGCGLCVSACHEGAIGMIDGKAHLLRDDYCDGLGDCLPACPTGAITFIEREAAAYNEDAVRRAQEAKMRAVEPEEEALAATDVALGDIEWPSQLGQWPAQIKLVPVQAPYFDGAILLVAADCTAFAYASFHEQFMKGPITLIGCPKLDGVDYSEKLSQIIALNDIRSVVVARMQVPCCGGLEFMTRKALEISGKDLPLEVVTFTVDGQVLSVVND